MLQSASKVPQVKVKLKGGAGYSIEIGAGMLKRLGPLARDAVSPQARRVAIISNRHVFELYGERAVSSLRASDFAVTHWLMGEGERFKSFRTAEVALDHLSTSKLERSDAVLALGGGVVGDLAGFAAALYLRGISFVQAPTTLLAQIDSSVGGKTGVNTASGKNLVGAFHQPRAVAIDTETLLTLPRRELTAGFCEAIKQGAAGDLALFKRTFEFLNSNRRPYASGSSLKGREEELARLIAEQCAFKARIVAGDEREDINRTDGRSRRILNFGHTVGHALEAVTNYRRFRHGEAVGHGMLAAAQISKTLGLLAESELESLREAVRLAGRLPRASDIDIDAINKAVTLDKKSVAGSIRWVLLERLGKARVVDGREVSERVLKASLREALK